jgi:hypothetical protein
VGKTRASKRLERQIAESARMRGEGLVRPEEVTSNERDDLLKECARLRRELDIAYAKLDRYQGIHARVQDTDPDEVGFA